MRNLALLFYLLVVINLQAQHIITNGQLSITISENNNGVELTSIKDNGAELINPTDLFSLSIHNTVNNQNEILTAASDWGSISINNSNGNCTIVLSNPSAFKPNLPTSLTAKVTFKTNDFKSEWDLEVTGLGNCSLMETTFPIINVKAAGNDDFFVPYFYGQVTHNPASGLNYLGLYPRGWGASMQYMAYYNSNRGLYFGFHDPKASHKKMIASAAANSVNVEGLYSIPDKTIAGNDWALSGVFAFNLFQGDWYDAALIYKKWASTFADFWPKDTPERIASQQNMGNIGMWVYNNLSDYDNSNLGVAEGLYREFADFIDVPFGLHLYNWNYKYGDDDYPNYFPERDGMDDMVQNLQNTEDISIIAYINGRLFDTDLPEYDDDGFPYATKISPKVVHSQDFDGNHFAVMCPSQAPWQQEIVDASSEITNRIGTSGIYIDQVCAASPVECLDVDHGHKLGAGPLWRDGYVEMFNKVDLAMNPGRFITSEGGCDYLADVVDGFMVQGWTTNDMVPAFSVIYAGKVQLFGTRTGTGDYGKQHFYGKFAQSFNFGAQTGRLSVWIGLNLNNASNSKLMAGNYVKSLGKMRHKLKDFMSFGQLFKPLDLNVPEITFPVNDFGTIQQSTIDVIQNSVWKNKANDKLLVLFTNASMTDNHSFNFDLDISQYGLNSPLTIQEVTPTSDGEIISVNNTFNKSVSISARGVVAYIISGTPVATIETPDQTLIGVYPNPAADFLKIAGKGLITSIRIVNMDGVVLKDVELSGNSQTISLANNPNGVYLIQVNSNLGVDWYKFIVEK